MEIDKVHHIAIIGSDIKRSRHFYVEVLGFKVLKETYRVGRDSWKIDLAVPGGQQIELFSFPNPPARVTSPEARGLRHLAFQVGNVEAALAELKAQGIRIEEPLRVDEITGREFAFFFDPDDLPLELYEGGE